MINPPIITSSNPSGTNSHSTKPSKNHPPEAVQAQQTKGKQSGKRLTEGNKGSAELQSPKSTSQLKTKTPTDQASASAPFSEILSGLSAEATDTDGTPQILGQKVVQAVEAQMAQPALEDAIPTTDADHSAEPEKSLNPSNPGRAVAKKIGAKSDSKSTDLFGMALANGQAVSFAQDIFMSSPTALEADAKSKTDSIKATESDDHNKLPLAANDTSSPADLLLAMLLLPPHDIKSPITKEEASGAANPAVTSGMDSTQTRTKYDLAASYQQAAPNQASESNSPYLTIAPSPEAVNLVTSSNKPSHTSLSALAANPNIATAMPNVQTYNNLPDYQKIIATPLSSINWADEFSQKINWMSMQQNYVAELYLNPPDLGALDVVLSVSGNQADALFNSPHSAVRDAVESALPKLRELLAENGINLGSATVNDQPLRDRDPERFMRQNSNSTPGDGSTKNSKPDNLLPTDAKFISARRHLGMVDTFA